MKVCVAHVNFSLEDPERRHYLGTYDADLQVNGRAASYYIGDELERRGWKRQGWFDLAKDGMELHLGNASIMDGRLYENLPHPRQLFDRLLYLIEQRVWIRSDLVEATLLRSSETVAHHVRALETWIRNRRGLGMDSLSLERSIELLREYAAVLGGAT